MPEYDVELRHITKRFGDVLAVDDVSFGIARGRFLTLLGSSGCGKTTTLRMIGGFEFPDAGEIFIRGEAMGTRPPYRRPSSMVFQNYALFPHLSVFENVAFGLRERRLPRDEIRRRVEAALTMVDLPHVAQRRPRQLSGGQQQRIALARSLVLEPTVLLLDEPLGALDLKLRKQMQIELKAIQARVGITFIYVTHDQEEALTMSDTIAVMRDGKIEQMGTPSELYERPKNRFVASFLGADNLIEGTVSEANGDTVLVALPAGPARVALRPPGPAPASGNDATPPRPGTSVALSIRPEKLFVGRELDVPNRWRATILDRVYKGAFMAYTLRLIDGSTLQADTLIRGEEDIHPIGSEVQVGFRLDGAVLLAE